MPLFQSSIRSTWWAHILLRIRCVVPELAGLISRSLTLAQKKEHLWEEELPSSPARRRILPEDLSEGVRGSQSQSVRWLLHSAKSKLVIAV